MKRKICVIVASRANYARIKTVLKAIKEHPDLELQLVVSASALLYKYGSVIDQIKKDGFEPAATCYIIVEGENPTTMAKSTGLAVIELATIFNNLKPDVVLTVADRYETLATAIAASYMNIPLAHTQGGEITGTIDESVRHSVTRLAHVHFPASKESKERLIKMGENPESIFLTGCPSMDLLKNQDLSLPEDFFKKLFGVSGVGSVLNSKEPYLVVMQHPVTTEFGNGVEQINHTIEAIKKLKMQTIWFWPNPDAGSDEISKGLRIFRENDKPDYVYFIKNISPEDYARLISNCSCLIGNSSSAIREGSFLGVPAVNIGTRQNGREHGKNIINVDYNSKKIFEAISKQIEHGKYEPEHIYGDGNAGKKIADVLAKIKPQIQKKLFL